MKLVVISPEHDDARETAVLGELFAAGLERYHVRKPHVSASELERWLRALPPAWRPRLVLHQHHELVARLGLGGRHWRDKTSQPPEVALERGCPHPLDRPQNAVGAPRLNQKNSPADRSLTSRSCHDLPTLRASLGKFDSVFFSPVFPSLSKPGHALRPDFPFDALTSLLATRAPIEPRTTVLALGGITIKTAPRALALGFDGVAVLGAIWQAADPARAFATLKTALSTECPNPPSPPNPQSAIRNPQFTHAA